MEEFGVAEEDSITIAGVWSVYCGEDFSHECQVAIAGTFWMSTDGHNGIIGDEGLRVMIPGTDELLRHSDGSEWIMPFTEDGTVVDCCNGYYWKREAEEAETESFEVPTEPFRQSSVRNCPFSQLCVHCRCLPSPFRCRPTPKR